MFHYTTGRILEIRPHVFAQPLLSRNLQGQEAPHDNMGSSDCGNKILSNWEKDFESCLKECQYETLKDAAEDVSICIENARLLDQKSPSSAESEEAEENWRNKLIDVLLEPGR